MSGPLLGIGLVVLGALLATTWAVMYELMKQNGRILARIDALERQADGRGKQQVESRILRQGLKAGTTAPLFELPGIGGDTVSLAAFRGRRVLLVFSDPECGPCDELAPRLVQLHRAHIRNGLSIVMIGRGEPSENRRKAQDHGFEFPIALQGRWEVSKEYGIFATPVGFLIGENGVIERDVAIGTDQILSLAHQGGSHG
jgi:peroxiredoxin